MPVIVQFFKEISPAKLAASAIALVAFLVLFAIFMSKLGDNEFSVLYTDLDIQDSAKIAEELDNRKISYRAMFDASIAYTFLAPAWAANSDNMPEPHPQSSTTLSL